MITSKERKRITDLYRAAKLTRGDKIPDWALARAGAQEFEIPDPSVHRNQAEMYRLVPGISTAVDLIGRTAADSKLQVFKLEGEDKVEIPNHPLELIMEKPNPLDSSYEFRIATSNHRQLAGNCYWWLNKLNENAPPTEIWIIPPHLIQPVPDDKLYIKGYLYEPGDGQQIRLETWEIVHFKRFNPFNEFVGLSAIEALVVTAMGDIEARKWNTRFFGDNNGRLEGMVTFADQINNPDWERIQREFKNASKKREQLMMRGVGKGGVEWHQSKVTPREMEFLAGLEMNKQDIWDVLAPGLASMRHVSSNEANARVGETIFTNKTVWPWLKESEAKINQSLTPFFGDNLIAEYVDIRITDRSLELQEIEQYKEFHTIDETREKFYMSKEIGDERGDLLVVELGGQPSGEEVAEEITNTPSGSSPDESKPEDIIEEPVKSEMEIDLDKWRRKASKRIGESVPFESKHIPHAMNKQIVMSLDGCKDKLAVKAVFDEVMETPVESTEDFSGLVAMLDNAIKAIDVTPAPVPHVVNLTMPMKQDFSVEDITEAVASAVSGVTLPVPVVNIVNDVQPTPIENVIQTGDVIVPEQKTPEVKVDVNIKQVDTMKTTVRRNKEGDVTSLNTKVD